MTEESAEVKLGKVETALDTLIGEVRQLRASTNDLSERMTRLEESTRDAVSQVPTLREKVVALEKETAVVRVEVVRLRQDIDDLKCVGSTWGARLWRLAEMFLGPILAAGGTVWLMSRKG